MLYEVITEQGLNRDASLRCFLGDEPLGDESIELLALERIDLLLKFRELYPKSYNFV